MEVFSEAGQLVDIHLPTDRMTGQPRGFAFVEYATEEEAQAAIERFHGFEVGGRELRVNEAEERAPRAGGGGGRQRSFRDGGGGGGNGGGYRKPNKPKGSRRGLRGRKRSL